MGWAASAGSLFNNMKKMAKDLSSRWRGNDVCEYRNNAAQFSKETLATRLEAQELAVSSIVSSLQSWEFDRTAADRVPHAGTRNRGKPLVLAFTGPTGVGKTETSNLIAESLLVGRKRVANSVRETPVGFLKFNGGDFNDFVTKPIAEYHKVIKQRLFQHFQACNGVGVVLFDEVQKVIPGTLDVLKSILNGRPQLDLLDPRTQQSKTVYCDHAVFLFVSDIGAEAMTELVVKYNGREHVPEHVLNREVRKAMNAQWKRLNFEGLIDMVVPFLPFEPVHIRKIMRLKAGEMSSEHAGVWWGDLKISKDAIAYMSNQKFIQYKKVVVDGDHGSNAVRREASQTTTDTNNNETNETQRARKVLVRPFAKYGARLETGGGPLHLLRAKLFNSLDFNDDGKNIDLVRVSRTGKNALAIHVCPPSLILKRLLPGLRFHVRVRSEPASRGKVIGTLVRKDGTVPFVEIRGHWGRLDRSYFDTLKTMPGFVDTSNEDQDTWNAWVLLRENKRGGDSFFEDVDDDEEEKVCEEGVGTGSHECAAGARSGCLPRWEGALGSFGGGDLR
jgi:hypothetical protein